MTDASQAGSTSDPGPLLAFLLRKDSNEPQSSRDDRGRLIDSIFPGQNWLVSEDTNPFGPTAHKNLYEVEMQRDFRLWLQGHGIDADDYADLVGPIQYNSIQMQLRTLAPKAKGNRGWRIRAIGFPAIRVVALGLSSHYQGTQNHNDMGDASARIRALAETMFSPQLRDRFAHWPSATAAHWEERGLMKSPATQLGSLDITPFDSGQGAKLRMVRNTTVKKELSAFFAIQGYLESNFLESGLVDLRELRSFALELGQP